MKQTAPFGAWDSPVTVELACGKTLGLSELRADGADLLWLERRPEDQGRTALVRRAPDGEIRDLSPAGADVGTRVHEYGGGSYAARDGCIVWSSRRDGSVWLLRPGASAPTPLAAVPGCRFADFSFVPGRPWIVCVREDHRDRPETNPEAALVALSTEADADPAGNAGRVLVRGADFYASPRPSPDGARLAWISWNQPDMPWDATRLHAAAFGESGALGSATLIAGAGEESVLQPEWSPDGSLHFLSDRDDWWSVYRADQSAADLRPVVVAAGKGEIGGPLWSLGARWYGFAPDGRIVAVLAAGGQARMVVAQPSGAVADLAGAPQSFDPPVFLSGGAPGEMRIAFISASATAMPAVTLAGMRDGAVTEASILRPAGPDVLGSDDIAVGEPFSFPNGDGETAHAFWYPPTSAAFTGPAGERPPLIAMLHGGPTGSASNALSLRVQWWTSRGFGVVDVNYRGSTGYGRPYRRALDGRWGVADVEDCLAAARALADRGLVDAHRMAIRGGSAGGFTALAALAAAPLFRAGASLYGVADLAMLARDTHKFEARYLDRLVGPWPEAAKLYAERSPVNRIAAMTAPVIFFQGLDDKVVPPSQTRAMVDAMRARGLPVAHYEFAGESHGFRGAEALRRSLELELDFYGRVFGFHPPGLSERVVFDGATP